MTPIVVFKDAKEAFRYSGDLSSCDVHFAYASAPDSLRAVVSPVAYVSVSAARAGILELVRTRQKSFADAKLEVLPPGHIRLALGSAHDKLRLAAIRAGLALHRP